MKEKEKKKEKTRRGKKWQEGRKDIGGSGTTSGEKDRK